MFKFVWRHVALAAMLASVTPVLAGYAGATWHKTTYLTFSGPVSLPGVSLPAGTYVFELADPTMHGDIVRVFNRDRSRAYYTGFTERTHRPASWPADRTVTLGEATAGSPPPILGWYPQGEMTGHLFIYPGRS